MALSRDALVLTLLIAVVAGASAQCVNPKAWCDFVFKPPRGRNLSVPILKLRATVLNTMLTKSTILHKSGDPVLAASNANEYGGCVMRPKLDWRTCDKVFLFKGAGNGPNAYIYTNSLAQYPMTKDNLPLYTNKCIIIRLDNIRLARSGYLNNGDGVARFPQNRRCIVFRTV